jgi:hypothetical protein
MKKRKLRRHSAADARSILLSPTAIIHLEALPKIHRIYGEVKISPLASKAHETQQAGSPEAPRM